MADFADDATVRLELVGSPFPGIALTDKPTIPRGERVEVSGKEAKSMLKEALDHPQVGENDIRVDVVDEGTSPGEPLIEVVGEETAQSLAAAGFETLAGARDASDAELKDVTGVGPATVRDIRPAGDSTGDGSEPEDDDAGPEEQGDTSEGS